MNICVVEVYDSESPEVYFVDYVALQADPSCQVYAAAIAKALKRGSRNIGEVDYDDSIQSSGSPVETHLVKLPCKIDRSIMLFVT